MPVAPLQVIDFLEYVPHKCHIDVLVVMPRKIFFIWICTVHLILS
jgi:hypothetical protein